MEPPVRREFPAWVVVAAVAFVVVVLMMECAREWGRDNAVADGTPAATPAETRTDVRGSRREGKADAIQCKTSASFTETSIEKLKAFTEDLLDLSKDVASLSGVYNEDVIAIIQRFRCTYEALASRFPLLSVKYCYASKGIRSTRMSGVRLSS
jgi:hypothetical protein